MRDYRLDSIKASLIFLVVFGHSIEPVTPDSPLLSRIYDFLYLFHMPAFIFLNGYVLKERFSVNYQTIFYRLIIPFVALSLLYELVEFILYRDVSSYIKNGAPNWILWYLYSLIFWKLLTPLFMRLRFGLGISIALSVAVSFVDFDGYAFGVMRTLVFFPFYIAGVQAAVSTRLRLVNFFNPKAACVGALILLLSYLFGNQFGTALLYGSSAFPSLDQGLREAAVMRMCHYLLAGLCIYAFCALTWWLRPLTKIGTRTLYIYALHGLVVKYLLWDALQKFNTPWQIAAVALVAATALTWLLSRDGVKWLIDGWIALVGWILAPQENRRSQRKAKG
ncbi:acyltransferase family protein [Erwinia sp. CPCC 100877]|nr:acyltransferase family protein [Erwinia sp. CPCC 100877]